MRIVFLVCVIALDYLSLSSVAYAAREGGNEYIQASSKFTTSSTPLASPTRATSRGNVAWFSTFSKAADASQCVLSDKPFQRGEASWYGPGFNGKQMANGGTFNMEAATVAHKKLPLGTRVCIKNPQNERIVIATVTDRGPYVKERIVDLSKGVARALDITGVSRVEIYVM